VEALPVGGELVCLARVGDGIDWRWMGAAESD